MSSVEEWDRWFTAISDPESDRAWAAAKSTTSDPVVLDRWATIIELNRLDSVQKRNHQQTPAGGRGSH